MIEPFLSQYWALKKKFDAGKISEAEMQQKELALWEQSKKAKQKRSRK